MAGANEVEILVTGKDKSGPAVDSARHGMQRLEKDGGGSADALGGKLKGLGIAAVATAGFIAVDLAQKAIGKLIDFGGRAVTAASDLGESMNAVDKIFKGSAETIKKWGDEQANAYGLSQRAFQQLATPLGALLKNQGIAQDKLADTTINLTKRAADLASVFNTDVQDALDAITAGLRGESDPLERYGVSLSEAAVKAEAFALGLVKAGKSAGEIKAAQIKAELAQRKYNDAVKEYGANSDKALAAQAALLRANLALDKATNSTSVELTKEQEAAARLSLIMKQTADAAGDFRSTSDGLANSTRILAARQEELQAQIGQRLLPFMQKLNQIKLTVLEEATKRLVPALDALIEKTKPLRDIIVSLVRNALPEIRKRFDELRQKWEENRESIEKLMPFLEKVAYAVGILIVAGIIALGTAISGMITWLAQAGEAWSDLETAARVAILAVTELLSSVLHLLGKLPGQAGAAFRAAAKEVDEFRNKLAAIPSQINVVVKVATVGSTINSSGQRVSVGEGGTRPGGKGGAYAHGGIVGAAMGGIRSGLVQVAERGRELALLAPGAAMLPPGSTVIPNEATERALAGGGGSQGGYGEWRVAPGGDSRLAEFLHALQREGILQFVRA